MKRRRAVLILLVLYFLGAVLLVLLEIMTRPPESSLFILGGASGAILFGAAFALYYKRNWEPARHVAAITASLLVGLFLPEPFVTQYAPMAVIVPAVLALILTEPFWVILNSLLVIGILLARAGGSGVYADPITLILYAMIVGGLLVSRLIAENSVHQLRAAQQTIRQGEEQMMALVASLDDIVFQLDEQGTYLNVWAADENLLAQPKEQLLGKTILDALGEEKGRPFTEAVRRVVKSGHPESIEYPLEVIDGQRWFNARINPILEVDGSCHTASMLIREITEHRQAEIRSHESEELFRTAFQYSPVGMCLTTLDGKFKNVNQSLADLLGFTIEELEGKHFNDITHPEDREIGREALIRMMSGELPSISFEKRYIRKTGDAISAYFNTALFRDSSGRPLHFITQILDITTRKQAEEALANSEKRFRALIENAPDGIALLGLDGKLQQVTPTVGKILGYTLEESVGQDPASMTHPDDLPDLLVALNDLIQNPGKVVRTEYRFRHKDGSWRWLDSTISNMLAEPSIGAIVFNYRDITERKQAEAEIESLANFPSENTSPMLRFARDGRLLYANPASRGLLDMWGCEIGERPPERIQLIVYQSLMLYMSQEIEIAHDDIMDALLFVPILDKDYVNVYGRNITERKQAEEAVREAEDRYRTLVEQIPAITYIAALNETSSAIFISPQISTLGFTPEEWLSNPNIWFNQLHPDDRDRVLAEIRRTQATGEPFRSEYRMLARDGQILWFQDEAKLVCDESGQPRFTQGVLLNITERKRASQKIQRQLQRLSALRTIDMAISTSFDMNLSLTVLLNQVRSQLGVSAAAILLFDPSTRTLKYAVGKGFNSASVEQTQLRLGEGFAGRAAQEQRKIHVANLEQVRDRHARRELLKDEGFQSYYATPLIAKGALKGVLEIFERTEFQPNQEWLDFVETLAGQAAIAIDNSTLFTNLQSANAALEQRVAERTVELQRANIELEHANRAKDEFLASMSHELRTPLNSILGLSESLIEQSRGPLNEYQQKYLRIITSSGRHLLELINDILDLSKIEVGKFDFHPQLIAIDDLCLASLAFVNTMAAHKSITVTYQNESAVHGISADPRRLKQILINLLNNAVKFTPEQGQVCLQVQTDSSQDQIRFSVTDTGIGIAPENLQQIFQPFVQVDSSLNRLYDGTGLGLALVQRLTDLHGGSVKVESEVNKGSCFTINLPLGLEPTDQPESTQTAPTEAQVEISVALAEETATRDTILIAEDNAANILAIGDYLEGHGYEIVIAHDGWEAVEKAGQTNPDIILMDIQMPVMDGLEATRRLRADSRFASTPIIALTALAMPGDRERCLEAGATEYMSKPVGLKMLLTTIVKLLGRTG